MSLSASATSPVMVDDGRHQLHQLQVQLEEFYDLAGGYPVERFLITDRRVSDSLDSSDKNRSVDEKLLIAQDEDGVAVTLYLDEKILGRLCENRTGDTVQGGWLNDYCVALEGVSHFVYFTFKASYDCPVSLLELELQAEVDKYAALAGDYLSCQTGRVPAALRDWLFDNPNYDPSLSSSELSRYRNANELASRFCRHLEVRYLNRRRVDDCQRQLRRFYRLSERKKLDWIRST